MRKLPPDYEIDRYGLHIRLVTEKDAEFILRLRTNTHLSRFLHTTSPDVEKQVAWTREYKKREEQGLDYYFIFERPIGIAYGVCRIYDIEPDLFTMGSWIFSPDSPVGMAVLADIITREIAFELMPYSKMRFDVRRDNINVIRYQKTYNPTIWKEDLENIYFELSRENFEKYKGRHLRMCLI